MTWAEALAKGECTAGEFSVAFERFKFNVYGSMWEDGTEFYDCLTKFLKSDFVKIWTEARIGE
ncbi:hypothetical protein [Pseudobutyrivibrio sp.]